MQNKFSRDRFTWLAYIFLASYGYFLNVIGPVTPFLKDELGLTYTTSSLHYTFFALGILLIGLTGNPLVARLGRWKSLWLGAAGLSLGSTLLIFGRTPILTIGATFLMGLVGSLILVIIPSALSDRHGALRAVALSEANVLSSLVSSAAPLLVGMAVRATGSWHLALGLAALTPLPLYFIFRDSSAQFKAPVIEQATRSSGSLPVVYWVYWLCLVLAVSAEFCMISWSADYLQTTRAMPRADAAQAVSLFFLAMIIGRLAGSRLVQRISTQRLVPAFILVALAGFLLYWQAANIPAALAGLFFTGLGIASLYPLILSMAIASAGSETVRASAGATLASGTAILTLPLVLGRLADSFGIHQAYGVVLLLLVSILLIVLLAAKLEPGKENSPSAG